MEKVLVAQMRTEPGLGEEMTPMGFSTHSFQASAGIPQWRDKLADIMEEMPTVFGMETNKKAPDDPCYLSFLDPAVHGAIS